MLNSLYNLFKNFISKFTPNSFVLHQGLLVNFFRNIVFSYLFFLVIIFIVFNEDREFFVNAFKDPASPVMEGIIDFHHDVFFFLIMILIFVSWFLIRILCINVVSEDIDLDITVFKKPKQIQLLEFVWTLIPTLILFAIAIPSFTLLYAMNELLTPSITVKATGNQWYWTYEFGDEIPLNYTKDIVNDDNAE